MELNATLLGQMITFLLFIWFTKAYVWPPLLANMQARQATIADGLAAAERGRFELANAETAVAEMMDDGRQKAAQIIRQAEGQAEQIIEQSKVEAKEQADRILAQRQAEIEQMVTEAREKLREQVSVLVVKGAEHILSDSVDSSAHKKMLESFAEQL